MMEITYLYNSGFLIETEACDILIDYISGLKNRNLPQSGRKLYILASHAHGDHFSKEIFNYNSKDTIYILSDDIKAQKADNIYYLKKGRYYKDEAISVQAFGSTDEGISFFINVSGQNIFHAGDLNNWHWNEESTPEEAREAEEFYKSELSYIAERVKAVDIVFFPIDPRLGREYMRGAMQFIQQIKTKFFIPMHFGGDYMKANEFKRYAAECGAVFVNIEQPGTIIKKRMDIYED